MVKRIVIGTAGHIDHGKTALIKALTGIDCDRLKEERERGITTELGFAHYRFGNDLVVGIVDVPGHERFVRHMVAGAWGIDMVLLVVAADEGIMPQTREHVDICELLGLKRGIVVITKIDLVDKDMLQLVREDVEDFLKGRPLEGSPIVPVSSTTGQNVDLLKTTIRGTASQVEERSREGIFRLPVDRVFTLKGMGTIITGTCISGHIQTGDEVEIYPFRKRARAKNIQAYHENVPEAIAGQRIALNLQGIERGEVERGAIVGRPDSLMLSQRVDATLRYLKLPTKPIKNNATLRFHVATTQEEARVILLNRDAIEPGEELYAQFIFAQPMVVLPGDRYILRGSYAIQTVGGGKILDILPRKHRRHAEYLDSTYRLLSGEDAPGKAEYHISKGESGGIRKETLSVLMGKEEADTAGLIETLSQTGKAKLIGRSVVHMEKFQEYRAMLNALLDDFHRKNPLRVGISKEELRTRLPRVDVQIFQTALDELVHNGTVEVEKDKVRIKQRVETSNTELKALEQTLLDRLRTHGFTPPSFKDLALELHEGERDLRDMVEKLVFEGKLVKVKSDMYYHRDIIESLKIKVRDYLIEKGEMTPGDFKTVIDISRKYMIPLLEHLDGIKLTVRAGDKRILRG
jgi:selenocysteine-specific elongation factor